MSIFCFVYFSAGVVAEFTREFSDVVKNVGDEATLTFGTDFTSPDLLRFVNETWITLVSSGDPRMDLPATYNLTIVHHPHSSYLVTLKIMNVTKEDAGPYLARSDNDRQDSSKNYVELVVIGKSKLSHNN